MFSAIQVAALTTREAKECDVPRVELIERWQRRAEELGLDGEAVRRTFDPEAFRSPPAPADDRTVSAGQVDRAVTSGALSERRSSCRTRSARNVEFDASYLAERARGFGRRDRRRELERIDRTEAGAEKTVAKCEAEAREKSIEFRARAELEATERILAERRELAVTATRIVPPAYITKELGERPTDPEKRRSWEAGVRTIEGYRQEHGVKDRDHALGQDTSRSAERAREQARQRLRQSQRELGRLKEARGRATWTSRWGSVGETQWSVACSTLSISPQSLRWLGARPASAGLSDFRGRYQPSGL